MTTLHLSHKESEKCGFKKYVKVMSNLKIITIINHYMKNLLMKCIETFLIYSF
jgi:hypothetical protein